ncbi:MAG: hypothetical protein AB7Q17_11695 [Phycisphaerae bacterium]
MKLPAIEHPEHLQGLYVYDFGEWTAVGYTADEIAMLLESEQYRDGKVYRIHRAAPSGQMELQGVSPAKFLTESGMFFYRTDLDDAERDFDDLERRAQADPPPCRAFIQLAELGADDERLEPVVDPRDRVRYRGVVALIYPAEHEQAMGDWLVRLGYAGGTTVDGGPSCVTTYRQQAKTILARRQLWNQSAIASRSASEVLAAVRRPVQR